MRLDLVRIDAYLLSAALAPYKRRCAFPLCSFLSIQSPAYFDRSSSKYPKASDTSTSLLSQHVYLLQQQESWRQGRFTWSYRCNCHRLHGRSTHPEWYMLVGQSKTYSPRVCRLVLNLAFRNTARTRTLSVPMQPGDSRPGSAWLWSATLLATWVLSHSFSNDQRC
jgi:hypothetical protein